MDSVIFPTYDFTFVVEGLLFEQGAMTVKYTPTDTRLTSITYTIPIQPDININNLKPYVAKFAPNNKWFAQEIILNNSSSLINASA